MGACTLEANRNSNRNSHHHHHNINKSIIRDSRSNTHLGPESLLLQLKQQHQELVQELVHKLTLNNNNNNNLLLLPSLWLRLWGNHNHNLNRNKVRILVKYKHEILLQTHLLKQLSLLGLQWDLWLKVWATWNVRCPHTMLL